MRRYKLYTLLSFILLPLMLWAQQDTDHNYRRSLKDVLDEIQTKYHVRIKYTDDQVKDKYVNYADWRFRNTVDETLANVLAPVDMKANKTGPTSYKLKD